MTQIYLNAPLKREWALQKLRPVLPAWLAKGKSVGMVTNVAWSVDRVKNPKSAATTGALRIWQKNQEPESGEPYLSFIANENSGLLPQGLQDEIVTLYEEEQEEREVETIQFFEIDTSRPIRLQTKKGGGVGKAKTIKMARADEAESKAIDKEVKELDFQKMMVSFVETVNERLKLIEEGTATTVGGKKRKLEVDVVERSDDDNVAPTPEPEKKKARGSSQ